MGIRGLKSFMDLNPQLFSDLELSNCQLVIDGNNLCNKLYHPFHCNKFTGGEYDVFYTVCANFFTTLKERAVVPYVVFDGAHDIGDHKLRITMHRAKDRLKRAMLLSRGYDVMGFLPIFGLSVFEDVLRDLDVVTFAHSDYEADNEIVALANELKCPVLSEDSDFYIYDLVGGFIPFGSLNFSVFKKPKGGERRSDEHFCLSVKIYFLDNFVKALKNVDRNLLPLAAVIMGNDYVDESDLSKFYRDVIDIKKNRRAGFRGLYSRKCDHRLISVLSWVRTKKTVEEVMSVVMSYVKVKTKRDMIHSAVDSYTVGKSYIAKEFGIGEDRKEEEKEVQTVTASDGSPLPFWFVCKCRKGEFPQFLMNVAVHRRAILLVQLERWDLESVYASSLHLRCVLYGMLFPASSHGPDCSIVEIGRKRSGVHRARIVPLHELADGRPVPSFENVRDLDRETRLCFVMAVLGVLDHDRLLDGLPSDWHLFVCTVIHWVRTSQFKLPAQYLDSMILMGIYVVSTCLVTSSSSRDVTECSKRLLDFQTKQPRFTHGHKPNVSSLHAFGELQTCLFYAECLNCLVGRPLSHFRASSFVNGTLFYNLNEVLLTRAHHETLCAELLGKDSSAYEFYCNVRTLIMQRVSD